MEVPRAQPEGLLLIFPRYRGNLITNFPSDMVLLCNTMIGEEARKHFWFLRPFFESRLQRKQRETEWITKLVSDNMLSNSVSLFPIV